MGPNWGKIERREGEGIRERENKREKQKEKGEEEIEQRNQRNGSLFIHLFILQEFFSDSSKGKPNITIKLKTKDINLL